MTFETIAELLDRIDEECLAEHGQTAGLGVCGTKRSLRVSYGGVLWDSDDDPTDDPEELKRHLLDALEEIVAGFKTAVATLEERGS